MYIHRVLVKEVIKTMNDKHKKRAFPKHGNARLIISFSFVSSLCQKYLEFFLLGNHKEYIAVIII